MAVSVTTAPQQFSIRSYQGNWWISYQSEWVGYFPGALWNNTFTSADLVFAFGEVTGTGAPCTDMGTGAAAASTTSAQMGSISYVGATAAPAITSYNPSPYYSARVTSSNSFRYGGAGAC